MVAIARLACSGHLTRYKNARIIVPMGAAGLPFLIGRLKQNHKVTPGVADPVEQLSQLYWDSILHDARVLRFVISILGADKLMMGSDMPFPIGDDEPMTIVQEAGLTPAQVASVNGGLAAKLFRIK
jgi:aminocarboxymuconate-semialdehyde decarboxylase